MLSSIMSGQSMFESLYRNAYIHALDPNQDLTSHLSWGSPPSTIGASLKFSLMSTAGNRTRLSSLFPLLPTNPHLHNALGTMYSDYYNIFTIATRRSSPLAAPTASSQWRRRNVSALRSCIVLRPNPRLSNDTRNHLVHAYSFTPKVALFRLIMPSAPTIRCQDLSSQQ